MRIPRVHVETELTAGAEIALADTQTHYLKHVLRLKPGAALLLFNGSEAVDYQAELSADGKKLTARIGAAVPVHTESPLESEIIQGLGRGDHMDWMIQKTTELGVNRIRLFNAARTQSPLKAGQREKKLQHWRSVAISACEQSGRALLPEILFYTDLGQAIAATAVDCRLLLDFAGASLNARLATPQQSVSILLGPEGGLNPAEIEQARQAEFMAANLGPRVLRTETAAASAIAIVQALAGDLG
jgi:16S rRNA (uracil1498-N3)-methyltransferase